MFTRILTLAVVAALSACGGGGDSGAETPPSASYTQFGGLSWSAPSSSLYTNTTLGSEAMAYCTQQTCSDGQCRMTNFNGEAGWRLPSLQELQAHYNASKTWAQGYVWSENAEIALDFSTGHTIIAGDAVTGHVTCVKEL
jgi:hypothetical protein